MELSVNFTGATLLSSELKRLRGTAAQRIISHGTKAGALVLRGAVRSQVPMKFRRARAGFRHRKLKTSEFGWPGWKFGPNVGKVRASTSSRVRGGKKGVGFSRFNSFWLILGAGRPGKPRRRKSGGQTGIFRRQMRTVESISRQAWPRMFNAMRVGKAQRLRVEIRKGKAFV